MPYFIKPKYLSSIERGKENPTLNTLINLAESLQIDLSEIFTFVEKGILE
ncbi:helix-turn-helix transcriptional regulator, partial [Candidatus Pacearchaeota archaeon]|nr:helix-turn-helix transcriptional regulator [Candidatus Pacearchaeota archaeon]